MNAPYIKKFDKNGSFLNPIEKDKPYINIGPSARGKSETKKIINNRKPNSKRGPISRLYFIQKILRGIGKGRMIIHYNNRAL